MYLHYKLYKIPFEKPYFLMKFEAVDLWDSNLLEILLLPKPPERLSPGLTSWLRRFTIEVGL